MVKRDTFMFNIWGGGTKGSVQLTFLGMPTAAELIATIELAKAGDADVERWAEIVRQSGFDAHDWEKESSRAIKVAGVQIGTINRSKNTVYEPLRSTSVPVDDLQPCTYPGPRCPTQGHFHRRS